MTKTEYTAFSEFDEQVTSKDQSLALLRTKIAEYRRGDESYGVIAGYERAAVAAGATWTEVEALYGEPEACDACGELIPNKNAPHVADVYNAQGVHIGLLCGHCRIIHT